MTRIYETYLNGSYRCYLHLFTRTKYNELGELILELEELGIQYREQLDDLEQFSIQLEK